MFSRLDYVECLMPHLDVSTCAQVACLLEVTARKAGNVHRERDFEDTRFLDFQLSAAAIGPPSSRATTQPVGQTILECVQATRRLVRSNTNLGIVLLLAPLAAVPRSIPLVNGIGDILDRLTIDDARLTYAAIRLAHPGGLGEAPEQDVADEPTITLCEAMALAAERDLVARQYTDNFHAVLNEGLPILCDAWSKHGWESAIQLTHLHLIAAHPDSLIARKRGLSEAMEASRRARDVLGCGFPDRANGKEAFAGFDAWLREDGHSRNPGTSADLVTACLFAGLREGRIHF